jgi:hypothetical protein
MAVISAASIGKVSGLQRPLGQQHPLCFRLDLCSVGAVLAQFRLGTLKARGSSTNRGIDSGGVTVRRPGEICCASDSEDPTSMFLLRQFQRVQTPFVMAAWLARWLVVQLDWLGLVEGVVVSSSNSNGAGAPPLPGRRELRSILFLGGEEVCN